MKNFIEVTKCDEKCLINVNNILCVVPITENDKNIIAEKTNSKEMQELFDLLGDDFKEKITNIQEETQNINTIIELTGFDKEHNKALFVKENYDQIKYMIRDSLV